jgi:hypothetical protein
MILQCPTCQVPLIAASALSWQCCKCGAKYLFSLTTTANTASVKFSAYKPKQEVPQAFQDAFAGKELEP